MYYSFLIGFIVNINTHFILLRFHSLPPRDDLVGGLFQRPLHSFWIFCYKQHHRFIGRHSFMFVSKGRRPHIPEALVDLQELD